MPATRPTRPSTVQQLSTGTLVNMDQATVSRLLSELADALSNLERKIAAGQTDDLFTATTAGDVPASGGGSTNFLRADGTWAAAGAGAGVATVTAGSAAVTAAPTSGAVVIDVVPANFTGIPEAGVTGLVADLAAKVPTTRTLTGTSPVLIDGGVSADLSANRTISLLTSYLAALEAFLWGTGVDGAVVFDGAATILGMAPVANVYTMTRSIFPSSMTVNTGVTIKTQGWIILVQGTLTGAGTALIHGNGIDAAGATAGAANWTTGSTYLGGGGAGATGNTGNGVNGNITGSSAGIPRNWQSGANPGVTFGNAGVAGGVGQGGSGGSSIAGLTSGGAVTQTALGAQAADVDDLLVAAYGKPFNSLAGFAGGSGGGTGAGDNVTIKNAGGSGSGGGWVMVRAKSFSGALTIQSKGGAGGNAAGANAGGGAGGAGGGVICLIGSGALPTLDVSGGAAGLGAGTGKNGGAGGPGKTYSLLLAP